MNDVYHYPPVEPFRTGWLEPGDGHRVFYEESGHPDGLPVLELHGGPGAGTVPEYPGTLDYLVASVAGCLIGTFGGTLKARGITATGDDLVADAIGEVGVDDDNVLHLRRIIVRYTLKAAPEHREAAERCNAIHAHHCPNARSVAAAIDIVTELDFVAVEDGAGTPA